MNLTVACSPHIRGDFKTSRLMRYVVIALLPALAVGIFQYGIRALIVVAVSIATALASEWLINLILRKRFTLHDGSAVITGLLLALSLPASVPLWLVVIGCAFAIVVVKALCGGLGQNVFNPALSGRALMMLIYPVGVTRYLSVDGVTGPTPMHEMAMGHLPEEGLMNLFLGNCPGSIGELSAIALLAGGVYLVARKVISPRIPLAYLGTVAVLTFVFAKGDNSFVWMLSQMFSGGLFLGAIFFASDFATSPVTPNGQLIFGAGCGALTVFFRYFGLYPEGVTYAILLMNACVWTIDRVTMPRRFGTGKGGSAR